MGHKRILILLMAAILAIPFFARSQSMSELNLGGFEKKKEMVETGAVKSPFAPARQSSKDMIPEDLFLAGVAVGRERSYALISGHILSVGDPIAGLIVKSIDRGRVTLQQLDKVYTLYLEGGL